MGVSYEHINAPGINDFGAELFGNEISKESYVCDVGPSTFFVPPMGSDQSKT